MFDWGRREKVYISSPPFEFQNIPNQWSRNNVSSFLTVLEPPKPKSRGTHIQSLLKSCFFISSFIYWKRKGISLSFIRDPIIKGLCFFVSSLWELEFQHTILEGLIHSDHSSIMGVFVQWSGRGVEEKEMQRRKRKMCLHLHFS